MKTDQIHPSEALPLIVEPSSSREATASYLLEWIGDSREEVQSILLRNGGVLFRGFNPETPLFLEELIGKVTPGAVNYLGGNSPRTKISNKVYTSTDLAASERITLHNELSYTSHWPKRIAFLCKTPAVSGGATPIADCRTILRSLHPRIVNDFREKGIIYIQNLHDGTGFGRSWKATFETEDALEVSNMLANEGVEFSWTSKGSLRIHYRQAALQEHFATRELLWFNQAEQWHPSHLDQEVRKTLEEFVEPMDFPHYVLFGDGSPISDEDATAIREISWASAVAIPWQSGDVMLLDNMFVAHGRQPFHGHREVYVAMG